MKFFSINLLLLVAAGFILAASSAPGQQAEDRAVEIRATIRQVPPRIALQWNAPFSGATLLSQKIYRRLKGAVAWNELPGLPLTAIDYADDAVSVGTSYEYFVYRTYDGPVGSATGRVSAGIRVPLVAERGRAVLLVDDTMANPLAAELAQFTSDLTGDGWIVLRQNVSRTATVTSVRAAVETLYNADPANTKALILFGHIPVPYSGNLIADDHPEHQGAWPADVYYGDVDGTWTDSTVTSTGATQQHNWNIPGDGKFDQSFLPSDVELQTGRIDLAMMPAFAMSETELLRQYLLRDHQFRHRLGSFANIPRRGLVDDLFGFYYGEAFCATAWRGFTALFGAANVRYLDWFSTLPTQQYLWAYGSGPGYYYHCAGVGATSDFAAQNSQAVFTFLFGSYFGDWDNQDNFLRAPLGGTAASLGLTCAWAGRPHWFVHPMGLGETIGYCARMSQNQLTTFPVDMDPIAQEGGVHIALMGDPTLRLHPVIPPKDLLATPGQNTITLAWNPGGDTPVESYIVSRASSPLGPFVRLHGAVLAGENFVDRAVTPGVNYTYMVRAVKLESTTSGSYLDPSQGVFSQSVIATVGAGPEINFVGNGNEIMDGDTVPLEVNGTDFGARAVGQPAVVHTFTIRNPGTVALTISSAALSGANAADFLVIDAPGVVAPGGSAAFDVSFGPAATGPRSAILHLQNNDADEADFDFALGGSGTPPLLPNDAAVVSTTLPATLVGGTSHAVSVVMKNAGTNTWQPTGNWQAPLPNQYRLSLQDATWGGNRVWLTSAVAPGQNAVFNFTVTAPSTPGTYPFLWRMVQDYVSFFGEQTPNTPTVTVLPPANSAAFAGFLQPVPSTMVGGATYDISVAMKNTGTNTWQPTGDWHAPLPNQYRLASQDMTWGGNRVWLNSAVAPGETAVFNFRVKAPTTAGKYNFQWQMAQDYVSYFGATTPNILVNVQ